MSASGTAHQTARETWTTERVALLKSYVNAGLSCGQIASEIGVSRNAVIGKINRLGLSARRPPILTQRRILRAAYAEAPPRADRADRVDPADPADPADEEPVASAERCSLLELAHGKCRWPLGDPGAEDLFFCGNRSVPRLSYCAAHARLAYRTLARRYAQPA